MRLDRTRETQGILLACLQASNWGHMQPTRLPARTALVLFALAVLIVAGFFRPFEVADAVHLMRDIPPLGLAWLLAMIAPILPLAIVVIRVLLPRPLPPALGRTLAIFTLPLGLVVTLIAIHLFDPGWNITMIKGLLLSAAAASAMLVLSLGRLSKAWTRTAFAGLIVAALGAVWSLASIPAVILQASHIAENRPFCLKHHARYSTKTASLWDLRGFTFYSMVLLAGSGTNRYEPPLYHGLLVVVVGDTLRPYYWSPARFRFGPGYKFSDELHKVQRIPPDDPRELSKWLNAVCTPRSGFFHQLSWWPQS